MTVNRTDDQYTDRKGDWMQLYSGKPFFFADPRPEDFEIEDIAHALSMQCRYAGHTLFFYSVAEHCVLLSHAVPEPYALEALLHDRAEAYLVDIVRPIKRMLPEYGVIEARLEAASAQKFGVPAQMSNVVAAFDSRICMDEKAQALRAPAIPWKMQLQPVGATLKFWTPTQAESAFRSRYHELLAWQPKSISLRRGRPKGSKNRVKPVSNYVAVQKQVPPPPSKTSTQPATPKSRILRLNEVVDKIGLSRSSIYLFISRGKFPASVKLGTRAAGWLESDIEDWLAARVVARRDGP